MLTKTNILGPINDHATSSSTISQLCDLIKHDVMNDLRG